MMDDIVCFINISLFARSLIAASPTFEWLGFAMRAAGRFADARRAVLPLIAIKAPAVKRMRDIPTCRLLTLISS